MWSVSMVCGLWFVRSNRHKNSAMNWLKMPQASKRPHPCPPCFVLCRCHGRLHRLQSLRPDRRIRPIQRIHCIRSRSIGRSHRSRVRCFLLPFPLRRRRRKRRRNRRLRVGLRLPLHTHLRRLISTDHPPQPLTNEANSTATTCPTIAFAPTQPTQSMGSMGSRPLPPRLRLILAPLARPASNRFSRKQSGAGRSRSRRRWPELSTQCFGRAAGLWASDSSIQS